LIAGCDGPPEDLFGLTAPAGSVEEDSEIMSRFMMSRLGGISEKLFQLLMAPIASEKPG
jgi:hypothetical protein